MKRRNHKPHATAKIEKLADRQQAQLLRWLVVENVTINEAVVRCRSKFGATVGKTALSNFYAARAPRVRELREQRIAEMALAGASAKKR